METISVMTATLALAFAVWLCAGLVTAALVSISWKPVQKRISKWHAIDRDHVVMLLATLPSLLPTVLLLLVLTPSFVGLAIPTVDHCTQHPDHPHLCLAHPSAALGSNLSLMLLGLAVAALVAVSHAWLVNRRRGSILRQLNRDASTPLSPRAALVDLERPLALTFGLLDTKTLVSTGLTASLTEDEARVVLTHEAAHVRRRDPLRQFIAKLTSVPLWPTVRRALLSELALCAEEICDAEATQKAGDRIEVAQTILKVERILGGWPKKPHVASAGISGSSVELRVNTLLQPPAARRAVWGLWLAVPILIALVFPLHHGIEHLLTLVIGTH